MYREHLLAPIIGALSLCLASPAQAQEQTVVSYGDLNLMSEAGRQQFDRRISRAVRLVCGANGAPQVESLKTTMLKRDCIKDTSARTMAERAKVLIAVSKGEGTRLAALTVRR